MNVLIIGLGNMGGAIANALSSSDRQISVYGVEPALQSKNRFSFPVYSHIRDASSDIDEEIDAIILSVKPQVADEVLQDLNEYLSKNTLVFTILAGVSISHIAEILKLDADSAQIARAMPTIAAKVCQSMTGITFAQGVTEKNRQLALSIGDIIGYTLEIQETQMAAITGASGSGIAFVAKFMDALIMAGVREGLTQEQACASTLQTVKGALSLLDEGTFSSPSDLISAVCSPGGTTIEGIQTLDANGLNAAVYAAVRAAKEKAQALGNS